MNQQRLDISSQVAKVDLPKKMTINQQHNGTARSGAVLDSTPQPDLTYFMDKKAAVCVDATAAPPSTKSNLKYEVLPYDPQQSLLIEIYLCLLGH